MIYAALMAVGILEFIFALLLALHFFDMEAEKEAEYVEGYEDGFQNGLYVAQKMCTDSKVFDEANCWFGMDGDA